MEFRIWVVAQVVRAASASGLKRSVSSYGRGVGQISVRPFANPSARFSSGTLFSWPQVRFNSGMLYILMRCDGAEVEPL